MKLNYFDLLSPAPIPIRDMGSILAPKLKDISALGYHRYQSYLTILLMDFKGYLEMIGQADTYTSFSEEEKSKIQVFDLLLANKQSALLLQNVVNFFMAETVTYSPNDHNFIVQEQGNTVGIITKDNYPGLCDLICQRNCIRWNPSEDLSKVKSKKAREIMQKLQKGRSEKAKKSKSDANMELGNIISAVANKSQSLNILNIWDLTVYQLWDCFSRLSNNTIYHIQSMSAATWGNKDHSFDAAAWFKRIDPDN